MKDMTDVLSSYFYEYSYPTKKEFFYMASPYSHHDKLVRIKRYEKVMEAMYHCIVNKIQVFCPVVHTHPIADRFDGSLPSSSEFWKRFDEPFLHKAYGLILVLIDGWRESKGMKAEFKQYIQRKSDERKTEAGYHPYQDEVYIMYETINNLGYNMWIIEALRKDAYKVLWDMKILL